MTIDLIFVYVCVFKVLGFCVMGSGFFLHLFERFLCVV